VIVASSLTDGHDPLTTRSVHICVQHMGMMWHIVCGILIYRLSFHLFLRNIKFLLDLGLLLYKLMLDDSLRWKNALFLL